MVCVLVILGAAIWTAAHLHADREGFFTSAGPDKWFRVYALSTTATYGPIVGIAIRLAIAAALDSAVSRAAATLGILGSLWILAAGLMGIAYGIQHHRFNDGGPSLSGPALVTEFAIAVLGMLLAAAAWRIATSIPPDAFDDLEEEDEGELQPVS
jgi:hypothetical protein